MSHLNCLTEQTFRNNKLSTLGESTNHECQEFVSCAINETAKYRRLNLNYRAKRIPQKLRCRAECLLIYVRLINSQFSAWMRVELTRLDPGEDQEFPSPAACVQQLRN